MWYDCHVHRMPLFKVCPHTIWMLYYLYKLQSQILSTVGSKLLALRLGRRVRSKTGTKRCQEELLMKRKNSSTSAENSLYTQTRLCWRLISISSKCWIPLNINHWTAEFIWTLTKLLSIICPSCASCAVYVVYLCNSYCLSRKVSILRFIGPFMKISP